MQENAPMTAQRFSVAFVCPEKRVEVTAKLEPMTDEGFKTWQCQQAARHVDCPACTNGHRLNPQDYFLQRV